MSVHTATIEDTSRQNLTACPPKDTAYRLYCEENSPRNLTAYPAMNTVYPLQCEIAAHATKLSSAPALPSNHRFLLDSFQPDEIKKVLNLLHTNSSLLPPSLLPVLNAQDFDGLIQFLLSSISTGHKEIFPHTIFLLKHNFNFMCPVILLLYK